MAARDVVRAVVESQAGYELAYFGRLTRFDDSWALRCLRRARGRDEALGFGPGETATLITAVVWIVLNEAAREFGSAAGDGMFAGLRALLRWLLRRKPKRAIIPPLTRDQQDKVCDMVKEELRKANPSEKRALAVANFPEHVHRSGGELSDGGLRRPTGRPAPAGRGARDGLLERLRRRD